MASSRQNIRELKDAMPPEEFSQHMLALTDIPIHLETLIYFLRVFADCIANVTPYFYGKKGKDMTRQSFRDQRKWFVSKCPNFDPQFTTILSNETAWFDVLAGNQQHPGLRNALVHYRGGIQLVLPQNTDLNGDGILDLVVTISSRNFAVMLMGNGDGTFGPPIQLPTHLQETKVAIGDLNVDFKQDLVFSDGHVLTVMYGNGDGTFQPATDYLAGASPGRPILADVNGDGRPDIVIPPLATAVTVLLNQPQ